MEYKPDSSPPATDQATIPGEVRAAVVTALVIVVLALCGGWWFARRPPPLAPTIDAPRQTAVELLQQLRQQLDAGEGKRATETTYLLATAYPGSPETAEASSLTPRLQDVVAKEQAAGQVAARERAQSTEAAQLAAKWAYDNATDPMTGRVTRRAAIDSENTVDFDAPYAGPQRGELMLREHPSYGRDVIFSIDRGQLLCQSYEDCQIRVRFDEAPAERWSAVGPRDNDTRVIFLRSEARFIQLMRKAKVVRIQVPVYQQGQPVFEFHVGGYEHERFAPPAGRAG